MKINKLQIQLYAAFYGLEALKQWPPYQIYCQKLRARKKKNG
jgi:hypothetical protein